MARLATLGSVVALAAGPLASGCAALLSTEHFHAHVVEGPHDFAPSVGSQPVWAAGGRLWLAGPGPVLQLDGEATTLEISTEVLGGRLWSLGPLLPLVPILAPLGDDGSHGISINLYVQRAARPVRIVLEELVLRPRASNVPLRPRSWTTTRWPDHETRPLAAAGRTEVLVGQGEVLWVTFDEPTEWLEAFELRLALEVEEGVARQFELAFERGRATYYSISP